MIAFGGLVRLTRSGLSIVEWNVITGIIPPLSENHWQSEFALYKQSPEYTKINFGMSLSDFKFIYHMEFWHRFFGRILGLIYLVPLILFLYKRCIPRKEIWRYSGIGLLFVLQGVIGWLMVKSGLEDRPSVSHIRLTLHLLGALALLTACLWSAFTHLLPPRILISSRIRKMSKLLLITLTLQIAAGGLVAGLKAGYVSNTFPLMFQELIPNGLLNLQPTVINLLDNPTTVHFQHRWFGFFILGISALIYWLGRRETSRLLRYATIAIFGLCLIQIFLGIFTVMSSVAISIASLHQIVAIALFGSSLLAYRCS
tara:strand:- start:549 stop:1487 length:939 start_codon:yes stop_codon:yes gene_type:complete